MNAMPMEFLLVREIADALRVSRQHVYNLISTGELPAVKVGQAIRVRREDLVALLARGDG